MTAPPSITMQGQGTGIPAVAEALSLERQIFP
jgi:hypothetical protein